MSGSSATENVSAGRRPESPADSPLEEPLFPQLSLRFLLGLTVLVAGVLWTIRAAWIGEHLWAKCAVVVLGTIGASFIAYALLFLLALTIATLAFRVVHEVLPQETVADLPPTTNHPGAGS